MKWKLKLDFHEFKEYIGYLQTKGWRSMSALWAVRNVRRKLIILPVSLVGFLFISTWTIQSNSSTLMAFNALVLFDILTLIGDILVTWFSVSKSSSSSTSVPTGFSFGLVRIEVLVHFVTLCIGILLNFQSIFVIIEYLFVGLELEIHLGRFLPVAVIGGLIHFLLSFNNNPLLRVYKISCTYTSLQKYFQGICTSFGLSLSSSSSSWFSHSPIGILGLFSLTIIVVLAFGLEQSNGSRWIDSLGGALIILGIFDTIVPLCFYTGQVLLQTVPSHVATQLEKALREALTIDGVLEFRNELFWTLTYGQIAGTLHVRVRRDANEQLVLSKVYEKLQPLAPHLTIQVTKDEHLITGRQFGYAHGPHILRNAPSPSSTTTYVNMNSFGGAGDYKSPYVSSSGNTTMIDLSPIPPAHGGTINPHLIYSTASSGKGMGDPDTTTLTTPSTSSLYPPDTSELLRETLIKGPSTHIHLPNQSQLNHTNVLISSANYFSE